MPLPSAEGTFELLPDVVIGNVLSFLAGADVRMRWRVPLCSLTCPPLPISPIPRTLR
jgi:hypothetical protein